jgi:hypothetical protein
MFMTRFYKQGQLAQNQYLATSPKVGSTPRHTDWLTVSRSVTSDLKFTDNQRITDTDICIFLSIFVHICIHSFRKCYTQFGTYPNYIQIKMFVKTTYKCFERKIREKKAQIRTNVRARVFNDGLLARSQFASGRSCDRPTRWRFSVVFLGPRVNAGLVPKFHFALHASYAALPTVTKNFAWMYASWCRIEIRSDGTPLLPNGIGTKTYWLIGRRT